MHHQDVLDTPSRDDTGPTISQTTVGHGPQSLEAGALDALIDSACRQACQAIAPAWPLDRAIAVNPHWGRIGAPVRHVAARMALLGGVRVYPSRSYFQQAWRDGRITAQDLNDAITQAAAPEHDGYGDVKCLAALACGNLPQPLPLLVDLLDDGPGRDYRLPWRQAVTHQISQTCAAYFDQHQADWQPQRQQGLYAFWRETLLHDHGIGLLMGLPQLGRQLQNLPQTPELAQRWVMEKLGLPAAAWPHYLEAMLLTINGWASWCAYLQWQAAQEGRADAHLRELLAIRLAWGAILLSGEQVRNPDRVFLALQQDWSDMTSRLAQAEEAFRVEEVWQLALEAGYQRRLAGQLRGTQPAGAAPLRGSKAEVQAAFCIDVRSEPLRRALESVDPGIQTIGFAGFFGLPIAYTPMGTPARRPQLPGLLAPALDVHDTLLASAKFKGPLPAAPSANEDRQRRFSFTDQWQSASRWPAAAFSFVEAFGWAYGGKLGNALRSTPEARARDDLAGLPARLRPVCRPSLAHLDVATRVGIAARVLHAMGLEGQLAPLVLLAGHGSQSRNNPHAAALDCGACGGQTGEVNARVLAQILNDQAVRAGLLARGIQIPAETVFVAALHNTTTDALEWFDRDLLPGTALPRLARLEAAFSQALEQVRKERAPRLGMDPAQGAKTLLKALQRRASDGAQTRPEWGLAGNAALIIAPRGHTRGLKLDGRSFLHDYDESQDHDGSTLELLMTAPMLVAHWINWQYHASCCEPTYFGSGNKVLHNVVGGHIGVFEGNGGDLRIGLSKQSLHDGSSWVHEPLRLTVVIAAKKHRIAAVIARHTVVRQLVEHGWLHLWQLENGAVARFDHGKWQPWMAQASGVHP